METTTTAFCRGPPSRRQQLRQKKATEFETTKRSRSRSKSIQTSNYGSLNVLIVGMLIPQPLEASNELSARHRFRRLYRQWHHIWLFEFTKNCLNSAFVLSLSKPSDRLSPDFVVGVFEACC